MEENNTKKHEKMESNKHYQGPADLFLVRRDLNILHKALYIGIVFLGLNLAWFGVWNTVSAIWPLNIPLVAIILGVFLLYITGKIKDLT